MKLIPIYIKVFAIVSIPTQLFMIYNWLFVMGVMPSIGEYKELRGLLLSVLNCTIAAIIAEIVSKHEK